jgi:metal-responsive CopG/Arc/MetJ family transcriptional regulator
VVTVATKIGSEELKRMDALVRWRGLLNRSDLVRDAIRLYLSLLSVETEARLRILRLINESVGVSGKTAARLVEEARREEDALEGLGTLRPS